MIFTANTILKNERLNTFSPKIRNRTKISAFISSWHCTECSSQGSGKKKNKRHPRHCILIKGSIHQDRYNYYIHTCTKQESHIYRKQILIELKEEINNSTIETLTHHFQQWTEHLARRAIKK